MMDTDSKISKQIRKSRVKLRISKSSKAPNKIYIMLINMAIAAATTMEMQTLEQT